MLIARALVIRHVQTARTPERHYDIAEIISRNVGEEIRKNPRFDLMEVQRTVGFVLVYLPTLYENAMALPNHCVSSICHPSIKAFFPLGIRRWCRMLVQQMFDKISVVVEVLLELRRVVVYNEVLGTILQAK